MTEKQKAEIVRMRGDGVSYKQISDVLSLSVNTIKSYCKRNNILKTDSEKALYASCLQCGKPVIQKEKTKRRKFCSDVCRRKWWNAHPEQVNRKALYKNRCECCGKEFEAYGNNHRKYCSHECYINARFKGGALDG